MTALRHPNVVLFMAASTKAPKMCIVMEYMSLGSLYEVRLVRSLIAAQDTYSGSSSKLLHNELISDSIPHLLKIKMAYQASKGMHFLHSSGTFASRHHESQPGSSLVGRRHCSSRSQIAQSAARRQVERQSERLWPHQVSRGHEQK